MAEFVVLADDEIIFPVSGYGSVFDLGRSVADHDHMVAVPGLPLLRLPTRFTAGTACTQRFVQLTAQFATASDV